MHARISALFLALVLALTGVAAAQETTGAITGRVTDAQGLAVPGTTVTVTRVQGGTANTYVTDADGRFTAPNLPPGRYNVSFEITGFKKVQRNDIDILLGRTFTLDSKMEIGGLTEVVEVTGEATPLVDVRSTVVQHNVPAEEFDQLPKSRSFQSMAMTAPSVNQGEIEGGMQVNGASGSENQFTVDGVSTNSVVNGSSRENTAFEYLQEVQVKTTGIPAEYGGALGGVVSAVTKSGGNTFVGEGHYYFQGSAISAGPPKRLVLDPVSDTQVAFFQDGKPLDRQNEIGGSLGGPIKRDKLFFFGSISPRFVHRVKDYNFSNGTDPSSITQDQTLLQAFGKVTYASNRFRSDFSALLTPTTSEGRLPGLNGFGPNFFSSSEAANEVEKTRGYKINQRNLTADLDWTVTDASFLSFKGGMFRDNYEDTGIPNTTSYTYQASSIGFALVPPNLQGGVGTQNTPRARINFKDTTQRSFFNVDYNQAFSGAGTHTLKGGVGLQHTVNDVDNKYPGGFVYLYWNQAFTSSVTGRADRGTYGYYEVDNQGTIGKAGADILSLYVQDAWAVNNHLSVNLGLRTENEKIPSFRPDIKKYGIQFGFKDKLAPRLGAAYDVYGDGRMKLFGSWGRYFDWTKYELARGTFGGDIWQIYYRSLDTLDINSLNLSSMPGRDLWGSATGFRDRRVPAFDTIDPEIKPMSQDSMNLGWEMQIGRAAVLSTSYVHNDLNRTIEDLGSLVNGDEVYFYANPGEGVATTTPVSSATQPFPTPRPKRQYDALQIELSKRFADRWFGGGSYVYSRLYGNYSGIQSSDEIRTPTLGVGSTAAQQQDASIFRTGGNANRAWDIDEVLWDSHGNLNPLGNLATDRPHVVKFYGAYNLPFGTQIGSVFYGGSGTPLTTYVNTLNQTEVMVNGRGDMGRTPILTRTDLLLAHELRMMGSRKVRMELNILNLFNQKTVRHRYNFLNRGGGVPRAASAINLAPVDLAKGYDYNALVRGTSEGANAFDPRFGQADLFSDGLQGQFMLKFQF